MLQRESATRCPFYHFYCKRLCPDRFALQGDFTANYRLPAIVLIVVAFSLRIAVVAIPGNRLNAPWSGGGDTLAYVTLAQNIIDGKGLSYANKPTALRPPGYPLVLAGMMGLSRHNYASAVRWLQFLLGLGTCYLCAATSGEIFGVHSKVVAFACALVFPTLVYTSGEILTETIAALFSAVFFYLIFLALSRPNEIIATGTGCAIGLSGLFRFNMVILICFVLGVMFWAKPPFSVRLKYAAIVISVAALILSPWLIRNLVDFHGEVLFSTHSGMDAVEGVLAPQGRALPAEQAELIRRLGYDFPGSFETNTPDRTLPEESRLNRIGWNMSLSLWKEMGVRLILLEIKKTGYFWLSTDQVFSTQASRPLSRLGRACGVLIYWGFLLLTLRGWWFLRQKNKSIADLILFGLIVVTIAHLPFAMNTRIRIPLFDPLLAILAAGSLTHYLYRTACLDPAEVGVAPQLLS
jgi:4-amino-4-deoxy-L-arabinose transferase-like glycosyltransferase